MAESVMAGCFEGWIVRLVSRSLLRVEIYQCTITVVMKKFSSDISAWDDAWLGTRVADIVRDGCCHMSRARIVIRI